MGKNQSLCSISKMPKPLSANTVAEQTAVPNWEVDSWEWVPVDNALALVRPGSLAETFLKDYEQYRKRGT